MFEFDWRQLSFLKSRRVAKTRGRERSNRIRNAIEMLEDRTLLSFAEPVPVSLGAGNDYPTAIEAGDFNGDGLADLALVRKSSSNATAARTVEVLKGDGTGGFSPFASFVIQSGSTFSPANALVAGRFTSADRDDLAVVGIGTNGRTVTAIYHCDSEGTFSAKNFYQFPIQLFGNTEEALLRTGDFDGDGDLDLAAIIRKNVVTPDPRGITYSLATLKNDQGVLSPFAGSPQDVFISNSVRTGDFNGDGFDDLVIYDQQEIVVHQGYIQGLSATTTFDLGQLLPSNVFNTLVGMGDFNNDGRDDLVFDQPNDFELNILLSTVGGILGTTESLVVAPGSPIPLVGRAHFGSVIRDFDGDGNLDLIESNQDIETSANSIVILKGKGDGNFESFPGSPIPINLFPTSILSADFNGLGGPDIFANFDFDDSAAVVLNVGDPQVTLTVQATELFADEPSRFTATLTRFEGTIAFKDGDTFLADPRPVGDFAPNQPITLFRGAPLALGDHTISVVQHLEDGTEIISNVIHVLVRPPAFFREIYVPKVTPEEANPNWIGKFSGNFMNGYPYAFRESLSIIDQEPEDTILYYRPDSHLLPFRDVAMEVNLDVSEFSAGDVPFEPAGDPAFFGFSDGEITVTIQVNETGVNVVGKNGLLQRSFFSQGGEHQSLQIIKTDTTIDVTMFDVFSGRFVSMYTGGLSDFFSPSPDAPHYFFGAPSAVSSSFSDWRFVVTMTGVLPTTLIADGAPIVIFPGQVEGANSPVEGPQFRTLSLKDADSPAVAAADNPGPTISQDGALVFNVSYPGGKILQKPEVFIHFNVQNGSYESEDGYLPTGDVEFSNSFDYLVTDLGRYPAGPAEIIVNSVSEAGVPAQTTIARFTLAGNLRASERPTIVLQGQGLPMEEVGEQHLAAAYDLADDGFFDFDIVATAVGGNSEHELRIVADLDSNFKQQSLSLTQAGVPVTTAKGFGTVSMHVHFQAVNSQAGQSKVLTLAAVDLATNTAYSIGIVITVQGQRVTPRLRLGFPTTNHQDQPGGQFDIVNTFVEIRSDRPLSEFDPVVLDVERADGTRINTLDRLVTNFVFVEHRDVPGPFDYVYKAEYRFGDFLAGPDKAGVYRFFAHARDLESGRYGYSNIETYRLGSVAQQLQAIITGNGDLSAAESNLALAGTVMQPRPGIGSRILLPDGSGGLAEFELQSDAGGGFAILRGGGSAIDNSSGNLIVLSNLNVVSPSSGNVLGNSSGNVISRGAGHVISRGAGSVISRGGGAVISRGGGANFVSAAGQEFPLREDYGTSDGNFVLIDIQGNAHFIGDNAAGVIGRDSAGIVSPTYIDPQGNALAISDQAAAVISRGGGAVQATILDEIGNARALDAAAVIGRDSAGVLGNSSGNLTYINAQGFATDIRGGQGFVAYEKGASVLGNSSGNLTFISQDAAAIVGVGAGQQFTTASGLVVKVELVGPGAAGNFLPAQIKFNGEIFASAISRGGGSAIPTSIDTNLFVPGSIAQLGSTAESASSRVEGAFLTNSLIAGPVFGPVFLQPMQTLRSSDTSGFGSQFQRLGAASLTGVAATPEGAALDAMLQAHFLLWHSELLEGSGALASATAARMASALAALDAAQAVLGTQGFAGLTVEQMTALELAGGFIDLQVGPANVGGPITPGSRVVLTAVNSAATLANGNATEPTGALTLGGAVVTLGGHVSDLSFNNGKPFLFPLYGQPVALTSVTASQIEFQIPADVAFGVPQLIVLTMADGHFALGQVTVQPSQGTLQFSSTTFAQSENGPVATVTVTRTGGSSGQVGVNFVTSGGSAIAGTDFTPVFRSVFFGDGDTTPKTIAIPVSTDGVFGNGDKTLGLQLSDPSNGATLGSQAAATLTIVDDVLPQSSPVFTTSPNPSVAENQTAVITVVALDADLPTQTVSYSITGGVDQDKFSITSGGVLTFDTAPDFENPTDGNSDNIYLVQVTADDGNGGVTVQNLAVAVTNVNDNPTGLHFSGPAVTWIKKQPPVTILPQITVDGANLTSGGTLTVEMNGPGKKKAFDMLSLPSSSGIGSITGPHFVNGKLILQIQLGANTTTAAIQTFLRGIKFSTKGAGLKELNRTLHVTLSSPGQQSSSASQTIHVLKKTPKI